MKKLIYFISITIGLVVVSVGCSGDSYQKRLDKEKKAISKAVEGYEILYTYPENHKFDKDQYYLEGSTGVYIQVVDPGDLNEIPKDIGNKQRMFLRFDSVRSMVSDSWQTGNIDQDVLPMQFEYLNESTYTSSGGYTLEYYFMSPALVLPLEKRVGNGAIVNIIVPFVNGSSYQSGSSYEPYHFMGLRYTFKPQQVDPEEKE